MEIMVATDIHGSLYFAEKIVEIFKREEADTLVLLGDLYYHGPRNPLPRDYAPLKVAELLNAIKDKLVVIKGNCDSEVDEMVSDFKFLPDATINIGGREVYFTHGHNFNAECVPNLPAGSVMFYGHFHINKLTEVSGITCVNVSSPSLPKDDAVPAYAIISEKKIAVKGLDGTVVLEKVL